MSNWCVYMIRCRDETLYTGISTDVLRRLQEHEAGSHKGSRYLRGKAPLELVFQASAENRSHASRLESYIKRLPRPEKLRLIAGEISLTQIMP